MSANSNLLLFLVTLHSFLSTGYCTASTTLLITGHSSDNNYKYAFAQKFVSQVELDRAHSADFLAISSDSIDAAREEEGVVLRTIGGVQLVGNLSQLVISNLGSNEMSLEHIQLLFKYIDTDQPLIVVEIGEQSVQTKSLLNKGALCWGEARANILSPNKAYICNDVPEETVRAIVDFQSVRGLTDPERNVMVEPQPRQFWPSFFASAARTEKKRRRKEEIIEVDEEEDVDEIVDQIMQDLQEREEHAESVSEHKHVVDHKLHCKYRKSCYESGTRPEIESVDHPWFDWFDFDVSSWFASKETKDEEKEGESEEKKDSSEDDDEDDEEDITPLKLKCKYRLDCYKRKGIKLSGKDEEREKRKSLLAGKASVQQGKKRTLKDIAERTISRVKVAEEKAAARPLPKAIVAERKLSEIEEKLNEKLQCKYRKSCYETGEPPVIEPSTWGLPTFSTYSAEEAVEQVDFEEMEDLEKKMFCKYRKSCYETGVKPDIEPDIQITSFHDLKQIPDVIESSRKMTLQEKCKYRKSCYETGILPEINPALEKIVEKEVSTVIPTNVNDLRKFCKYRKSCYEEIAESASVETVRNIRKRRLIEREVKRRKARRARMRRRLRGGDVELDSISRAVRRKHHASSSNDTAKKSHRARRYTVEEKASESPEPEVQKEEVAEEQQTPEPEETKKKTGKRKAKELAEEAVEEIAEIVEEAVIAPPRRGGKSRKQKAQEPEEVPQPEPEPEEPKSQPKSRGKKKKEVFEEPVAEQEPKEEEEKVEEPKPKRGKKREVKQEEEEMKEEAPQEEEPEEPKVIRRKGKKPAPSEPPPAEEEKPEEVEEPVVEKVVITASEGKLKGKKHREPEPEPQEKEEEHGHHKEHVNYKELQQLQMHCKYRKSCYETKERPVIVQTMATLFSSFDAHVNEHYDRVEKEELSEANQKLACKYRKSCYESGELPDLRKEREEEEKVEVKKHKEPLKKVHAPKKQLIIEEKVEEESKEDVSEEENESVKIHEHEKFHHLDVDQKLECKYRKSCYGSAKPKKFERTVVTAEGTVHRKKCNEYYLSCREQMGLPPKEKAPMGPNGRRLCRKKKTDQ